MAAHGRQAFCSRWHVLAFVLTFIIAVPLLSVLSVKGDGGDAWWRVSVSDNSKLQNQVGELEKQVQDLKNQLLSIRGLAKDRSSEDKPGLAKAPQRSSAVDASSESKANDASSEEHPATRVPKLSSALDASSEAHPVTKSNAVRAVVDTSVIPGARKLQLGLCSGNLKGDALFTRKKMQVMDRYRSEFKKDADAGLAIGAILELEECGMEAQEARRKNQDPGRGDQLRKALFAKVQKLHEKQQAQYEKARARLIEMMRQPSENGRLIKRTAEKIAHGHWVMSEKSATTCSETCKHVGQHCDVQMMENLDSEEAVKAAMKQVGRKCQSTEDIILYIPWDGPWWTPFVGSKTLGKCAFSEFAYTDCNMRPSVGFWRICACNETKGPTKATERPGMFPHIVPSLSLPAELLRRGQGQGTEDRDIVGPQTLAKLKSDCVVYAFGVAYQYGYERVMTEVYGCTVHSFDCTMLDGTKLMDYLKFIAGFPKIVYHPWCVGEHNSDYKGWDGGSTGIFLTLEEVMERLGHNFVDIIKFDIEGNEWKLFDSLLNTRKDLLPHQLAFELHTYGARRSAVPQELVGNKGEVETAELFNRLYDVGYNLISKEVNIDDRSCAEFLMVRV